MAIYCRLSCASGGIGDGRGVILGSPKIFNVKAVAVHCYAHCIQNPCVSCVEAIVLWYQLGLSSHKRHVYNPIDSLYGFNSTKAPISMYMPQAGVHGG